MKIVKDFKRGTPVPDNSKFILSRLFTRIEDYNGGHPMEWDTRIVEQYWIDTYEIPYSETENKQGEGIKC